MTRLRLTMAAGLLALPVVSALVALWLVGGTSVTPGAGLPDPGSLTRWGLPAATVLRDVSATLTVGLLVVACAVVPGTVGADPSRLSGLRLRLVMLAGVLAGAWVWIGLIVLALAYSDASGRSLGEPGALQQVMYFARGFDLGRYLFISSALAAVVAVGALWVRSVGAAAWLAAISLLALWPLALTGHAAGSTDHDRAVDVQAVHLLGVTVWVGGLVALILAARALGPGLPAAARRFSRLAGFCFVLVGASGVTSALLRVPSWSQLLSDYGILLAIKAGAFTLLGAAGLTHRRKLLGTLDSGAKGSFLRLAVAEVALMATTIGVAVALSRTPPPAAGPERPLTTAESLLGYPMPRPLGAAEWFTQWRIDLLWFSIALTAVAWYLTRIWMLRRRDVRWPVGRALAWITGWLLVVWATSGAPGAYGQVLFSMHMVQHMTIATAAPTFLVLGAPVTLALRTLPHRDDGSRGPREWLLAVVRSPVLGVLGHPLVASALFIASLIGFYYTPLLESSLRSHTMHVLMVVHFLATGYLFASSLVGIDPGIRRPAYPLRVLLVMVVFGFHAFFSVSLMASNQILARDWFTALQRPWGRTLADDQYLGASLGWALGDYPLAILAGALIWQWVRADQKERRRLDRQADRDGDHDLRAYNQYLSGLAAHPRTALTSATDADPGERKNARRLE